MINIAALFSLVQNVVTFSLIIIGFTESLLKKSIIIQQCKFYFCKGSFCENKYSLGFICSYKW